MGPNARASSPTPAASVPGFRSPVHVVADPGITDRWAMSRVLLSFCCSASQIAPLSSLTEHARPQPVLWRMSDRHTQKLGSLRISPTSGRSPPTRPRDWGGGSSCGRAGAGFPGTSPPAWDLAPALPSLGNRAGWKPAGHPGAESSEGPSPCATEHECEPYTCSLEHPAEKHIFFNQQTRAYRLSSMFPGAVGTRFS